MGMPPSQVGSLWSTTIGGDTHHALCVYTRLGTFQYIVLRVSLIMSVFELTLVNPGKRKGACLTVHTILRLGTHPFHPGTSLSHTLKGTTSCPAVGRFQITTDHYVDCVSGPGGQYHFTNGFLSHYASWYTCG